MHACMYCRYTEADVHARAGRSLDRKAPPTPPPYSYGALVKLTDRQVDGATETFEHPRSRDEPVPQDGKEGRKEEARDEGVSWALFAFPWLRRTLARIRRSSSLVQPNQTQQAFTTTHSLASLTPDRPGGLAGCLFRRLVLSRPSTSIDSTNKHKPSFDPFPPFFSPFVTVLAFCFTSLDDPSTHILLFYPR